MWFLAKNSDLMPIFLGYGHTFGSFLLIYAHIFGNFINFAQKK